MSLNRAMPPGQRHTSFDAIIIFPEPFGKTLKCGQTTPDGARQLGIACCWRPVAHTPGKILGERDGLGAIYVDEERRDYLVDRLTRRLEQLGSRISLEPMPAAWRTIFKRVSVLTSFGTRGLLPPDVPDQRWGGPAHHTSVVAMHPAISLWRPPR